MSLRMKARSNHAPFVAQRDRLVEQLLGAFGRGQRNLERFGGVEREPDVLAHEGEVKPRVVSSPARSPGRAAARRVRPWATESRALWRCRARAGCPCA